MRSTYLLAIVLAACSRGSRPAELSFDVDLSGVWAGTAISQSGGNWHVRLWMRGGPNTYEVDGEIQGSVHYPTFSGLFYITDVDRGQVLFVSDNPIGLRFGATIVGTGDDIQGTYNITDPALPQDTGSVRLKPARNPAPEPFPTTTIDTTGLWEVVESEIVATNTSQHTATPLGYRVRFAANRIESGGSGPTSWAQSAIESILGFPLDWYQNSGDGEQHNFGFGWDRFAVPGFDDRYQYGLRFAAVAPNVMVAMETEHWREGQSGPQVQWTARLVFARIP